MSDEVASIVRASRGYAIWVAPRMLGVSVWGTHEDDADRDAFYAAIDDAIERLQPDAPWDFFCDTHRSRLGDHDFRSVGRGVRWAGANREKLERNTRACAMVTASTAVGWLIAGSQTLLGMRYPTHVTRDIASALAALGPERAPLAPWIEALPDVVGAATTDVARLRSLLAQSPQLALADAARALGMSERSLQRMLAEHGTSFRALAAEVR